MYGFAHQEWDDPAQWGGIVTKGLTYEPWMGNPKPNFIELPHGLINSVGLHNPGWKYFTEKLAPQLNALDTNTIINVNGFCKDDYVKLAAAVDESIYGKAVELNISCPNIDKGGVAFGIDPEVAYEITAAVRAVVKNKPLIVKLTAQTGHLTDVALAVEKAGADAVSLINTLPSMIIDIDTQKPLLGGIKGGLSGPAIKPIAVKAIYDVYKVLTIPIIGVGGVSCGEDVIEFLLAGATLVQIGTLLYRDRKARPKLEVFIKEYLQKHNLKSVTELTGRAYEKQ